ILLRLRETKRCAEHQRQASQNGSGESAPHGGPLSCEICSENIERRNGETGIRTRSTRAFISPEGFVVEFLAEFLAECRFLLLNAERARLAAPLLANSSKAVPSDVPNRTWGCRRSAS